LKSSHKEKNVRKKVSKRIVWLAAVLPLGDPPKPEIRCWGLVEREADGGILKIRIGEGEDSIIDAVPEQVIRCFRTRGDFKNPQRIIVNNEYLTTLEFWLNLLTKKGLIRGDRQAPTSSPEPDWNVPIVENHTLAVVLHGRNTHPARPCFGVIHRRLGESYDVRIDRFRLFHPWKIIVAKDQIVPIMTTTDPLRNPKHEIRRLRWPLLGMALKRIAVMQRVYDEESTLREAGKIMASSNFVLTQK